jgi:dsDNA-binding SOS-regulon protein
MKEEIFKVNYESYTTVVFHDTVPITFPHSRNKYFFDDENEADIWDQLLNTNDKLTLSKKSDVYLENFVSNVEEDFVLYYGNPLARVLKSYLMIVVERDGDKVSMKVFNGFRERRVGNKWFKVVRNVDYITVNTKTGDVYSGFLHNYQNKKKVRKKLHKNFFLNEPISNIGYVIRDKIWSYSHNSIEVAVDASSKFMDEIDERGLISSFNLDKRLFKFYLDKKGIKYPNNFFLYSSKLVGPKFRKILKKNDNRLVDAFMINNGLTGKKLKKCLHGCKALNLDLYLMARKLFGDDWINQDDDFILQTLNSEFKIQDQYIPVEFANVIGKDELRRVFNLFKKVYFDEMLDTYTFIDHIQIYTQLKMYGETDLRWMSNDVDIFRNEHLDWSDKLTFYKKGHYERIYPVYSYEHLEQPLGEYYPVLLDDSISYNEESSSQSNCVKTYIGKPSNIIISLRKGSRYSEDRATIEYQLYREDDKTKCRRVQSLGKYNGKLSDEWTHWLLKLDLKMLYYVNDDRFETVKITKKCYNGAFFESNSYWDEDDFLKWIQKTIEGPRTLDF